MTDPFNLTEGQYDRLTEVISDVRDASPRRSDDAESTDILDAILPEIGKIVAEQQPVGDRTATAWQGAGLAVWNAWEEFCAAANPLQAAGPIRSLNDAISDLATFLPGYDYNTGTIVHPDEARETGDRA